MDDHKLVSIDGSEPTLAEIVPTDDLKPSKRELALRRLGLDPDLLPEIAPLGIATRHIKGGFPEIMTTYIPVLISGMSDEDPNKLKYQTLLELYATASKSDRSELPAEAFLLKAQIPADQFLGDVTRVAYKMNLDVGTLIASVNHPAIVETQVKNARKKRGLRDRELHLKAMGHLPAPKGAQILINQGQIGDNNQQNRGVINQTPGMPIFEADMKDANAVLRDVEDAEFVDIPSNNSDGGSNASGANDSGGQPSRSVQKSNERSE